MKALLVIDMEQGFLATKRPPRNNLQAEKKIQQLLSAFRQKHESIIHIQHVSLDPSSAFYYPQGYAFMTDFSPLEDEIVFQKQVNSAFIGTDLADYLKKQKINELILVGLTLPHCVSTTARMAGNLGFRTTVISDATASYALQDVNGHWLDAETIHQCHLAALNEEFAQIMTTEQFLNYFASSNNQL
ncbi:cysteine hydrolase family protein [Enterococcus columbae]|uniref:Isochorismatase-like domain-containing protein n=1 Tax=Enterococcus columbae DSM 7374 = ATCC 51263 TaxID=1121865 RepID=S1NUL2_9ENTE|nr:isochorismatase family protein [Enterococcus columbae]EOT44446.1 hypothetical protein OMW_00502 [Enterococcus columbae DSM 7374 = ATCC 51263]EOW84604.1 hypothetical protein I568_01100 [Enterococcus columbae DSM 7374 = ATCC 51263]OJG21442.1 hypothetical protein RR47_GL001389 [Enterococcus columbae DSM 7374 = ATCC 51263]